MRSLELKQPLKKENKQSLFVHKSIWIHFYLHCKSKRGRKEGGKQEHLKPAPKFWGVREAEGIWICRRQKGAEAELGKDMRLEGTVQRLPPLPSPLPMEGRGRPPEETAHRKKKKKP